MPSCLTSQKGKLTNFSCYNLARIKVESKTTLFTVEEEKETSVLPRFYLNSSLYY